MIAAIAKTLGDGGAHAAHGAQPAATGAQRGEKTHEPDVPLPEPRNPASFAAMALELYELLKWELAIATSFAPNGSHDPKADVAKKVQHVEKAKNDFDSAGGSAAVGDTHQGKPPVPGALGGGAKKTHDAKELVEVYGLPGQVKTASVTAYYGGKGAEQPKSGHVETHHLLVPILQRIFDQIRDSPEQDWRRILQKPGSYVPRPMRPDPTTWSIHSWGVAIDVNEDTNRYGAQPSADQLKIKHYFEDAGLDWLPWDPMHFQYHDRKGTSLPITDEDVRAVKAGKAKIDGGRSLLDSVTGQLAELNKLADEGKLGPKGERMKTRLEQMLKILQE
jgi:hypothetical protein